MSAQQARHYQVFGYVVLRNWFDDLIDRISDEFERIMLAYEPARRHDGTRRTLRWQMLDSSQFLSSLIDDERVTSVFSAVLGEDWQYFGSVGNLYAGETGWHMDDFSRHGRVKMALYLDPTGPGEGGLSVVPLSQHLTRANNELHMAVGTSRHSLGLDGPEIPSITLTTRPGDAVVFDHNILHAAWAGSGRRRMLSINAHAHYGPDEAESLRTNVHNLARFMSERPYGEHMVEGAPRKRQVHLEQLLAQQDLLKRTVVGRQSTGRGLTQDPLPDLTDNADVDVALAEFMRDTEYVLLAPQDAHPDDP